MILQTELHSAPFLQAVEPAQKGPARSVMMEALAIVRFLVHPLLLA
ncbi:hypothetical protein [Qipengyuania sp. NPDC077563]